MQPMVRDRRSEDRKEARGASGRGVKRKLEKSGRKGSGNKHKIFQKKPTEEQDCSLRHDRFDPFDDAVLNSGSDKIVSFCAAAAPALHLIIDAQNY